ncbi:DUF4326 domain-containing protein [Nonomuraea typhae]|uniref:DUF4326 domain-containing protein n=1 Tax=Nonomuraea typhae TaxID=2603600 RepID=UPI0012FB0293|nr:DUF4326 domain-containing protein [Nonomuraea typhae]
MTTPETRTPKRIQRKRTAGSRLPKGVICVDRSTIWGNPFKVGEKIRNDSPLWPYITASVPGGARGLVALAPTTREQAVDLYSSWVIEQPHLMLRLGELAGRDLACWCPLPELGQPDHCHAAYLIELVQEVCRA